MVCYYRGVKAELIVKHRKALTDSGTLVSLPMFDQLFHDTKEVASICARNVRHELNVWQLQRGFCAIMTIEQRDKFQLENRHVLTIGEHQHAWTASVLLIVSSVVEIDER
jgi:hypothetical protein